MSEGDQKRDFPASFFDEHRCLVLMGGGGSGKSIFAGRKVLERCTTERGHRWLMCRKVAKTLRESCFRQLVGQAHDYYEVKLARVYQRDMRITLNRGMGRDDWTSLTGWW